MPDSRQTERPFELIDHIGTSDVERECVPNHRSYQLRRNGKAFGFVRFNIAGHNREKFTVYSYCHGPLDDPETLFKSKGESGSRLQLHTVVGLTNESSIQYALRVLRASYERT